MLILCPSHVQIDTRTHSCVLAIQRAYSHVKAGKAQILK